MEHVKRGYEEFYARVYKKNVYVGYTEFDNAFDNIQIVIIGKCNYNNIKLSTTYYILQNHGQV